MQNPWKIPLLGTYALSCDVGSTTNHCINLVVNVTNRLYPDLAEL